LILGARSRQVASLQSYKCNKETWIMRWGGVYVDNIVKFPPKNGDDWASARQLLGDSLEKMYKKGVGEDVPEYIKREVLDRMAAVYREMPFATEISVYVDEAEYPAVHEVLTEFVGDFQKHIWDLIFSRLTVEMELAIVLHRMKTS
jgi:hypothetical protein